MFILPGLTEGPQPQLVPSANRQKSRSLKKVRTAAAFPESPLYREGACHG